MSALDFAGKLAGESLKELNAENYLLEIGSKTFVPGFEDHLIGMKKGKARPSSSNFPRPTQPRILREKMSNLP